MRLGRLSLAAILCASAIAAAAACSKFTGADDTDVDGGPDSEADRPVVTGTALCEPPKTPPSTNDDSAACMCTAPVALTGTNLLDAVVVNATIFGRRASDSAIVKADVGSVADPQSIAVGPPGASLGMASDGTLLYVATDSVVRSYSIRAPGTTVSFTPTSPLTSFSHVSFGTTVFYEWTATQIVKRSLTTGAMLSASTGSILDVAVDGDEAYFVVPGATSDVVTVAPFSTGKAVGTLPAKLIAFAVHGGFAYGASIIGVATQTTISRVALDGSANASVPLITEFGRVLRLAADGDRLYWVSNRGGTAPVLGSSDLCGGGYKLLATALPTTITDLSFDTQNVYVSGGAGADPLRQIAKKK